MTPPDQHYEDDLFPNDLPLPESLQWESMEDGILTKMDTIQKRKRKRRFIFWLFPLLLISGLGVGWWSFSAASTNVPQQPLSEVSISDAGYQSSKADIQENNAPATGTNNSQQSSTVTTTTTQKHLTSKSNTISPIATKKASASEQPTNANTINQQGISAIQKPAASAVNPATLSPSILQSSSLSPSPLNPSILPESATTVNQIDQLDFLLLIPPSSIAAEINEAERKEQEAEQPTAKAGFKPFLRAQIAGGLNWFTGNYKGADENFVMLRQESEYFDPGTQFSARLERGFAPGVFFGSGFDYKTYRTRLDTEAQSTINRLSSMVLLRFNEDPITGDSTNQEFVDTMLTVHQLRQVRHYNRYTSLEIPLYLGYEFNFGRFGLALTGGLAASISREMEGRIFDRNGDVVSLGEEDFVNYRTGLSLAAAGGLRLGYRLTDKFSITLGGGYQRFISNWMENSTNALDSRPAVWSTNLGAAWRF